MLRCGLGFSREKEPTKLCKYTERCFFKELTYAVMEESKSKSAGSGSNPS